MFRDTIQGWVAFSIVLGYEIYVKIIIALFNRGI
jgi:hypothetical protein